MQSEQLLMDSGDDETPQPDTINTADNAEDSMGKTAEI